MKIKVVLSLHRLLTDQVPGDGDDGSVSVGNSYVYSQAITALQYVTLLFTQEYIDMFPSLDLRSFIPFFVHSFFP